MSPKFSEFFLNISYFADSLIFLKNIALLFPALYVFVEKLDTNASFAW